MTAHTETQSSRPQQNHPSKPSVSELLAQYTSVVRQIVGGFQRKLPRSVLREDLLAAGMSGLWDAIRRHGDRPSQSFEWYVRVRIRGAILDELRTQDWLPRRARARAAQDPDRHAAAAPAVVRLEDVSDYEHGRCLAAPEGAEAALDDRSTHETLTRAVGELPDRERHIVMSHYFRGVKFRQLGAELGVSEPRISQLHSRAMTRLKSVMTAA
ncbi:MAG TPA: sigma-70 family RNA polymerase sigma factor [Polyangiaceae bacterium]|jgi:RNA polymerase sigma factor for flagellar operon FliA